MITLLPNCATHSLWSSLRRTSSLSHASNFTCSLDRCELGHLFAALPDTPCAPFLDQVLVAKAPGRRVRCLLWLTKRRPQAEQMWSASPSIVAGVTSARPSL